MMSVYLVSICCQTATAHFRWIDSIFVLQKTADARVEALKEEFKRVGYPSSPSEGLWAWTSDASIEDAVLAKGQEPAEAAAEATAE